MSLHFIQCDYEFITSLHLNLLLNVDGLHNGHECWIDPVLHQL
jgi:hypothetical protein